MMTKGVYSAFICAKGNTMLKCSPGLTCPFHILIVPQMAWWPWFIFSDGTFSVPNCRSNLLKHSMMSKCIFCSSLSEMYECCYTERQCKSGAMRQNKRHISYMITDGFIHFFHNYSNAEPHQCNIWHLFR